MRLPKVLTLLCAVVLAPLVLSFSIAVPILFRPFYYFQIDALDLPETTGWSKEVIQDAYDQVLDYCVLGKPFGTGQLAWSQSGYSHFADVRQLFLLDFWVLGVSAALCAALLAVRLWMRKPFATLLSRGPGFWAGTCAGGLVLVIAGLAALDFDRAFVVFHALFFPGKDNWIFDARTDQIILVMPEVFFRNCAILIGVVLLTCCTVLILADLLRRRR